MLTLFLLKFQLHLTTCSTGKKLLYQGKNCPKLPNSLNHMVRQISIEMVCCLSQTSHLVDSIIDTQGFPWKSTVLNEISIRLPHRKVPSLVLTIFYWVSSPYMSDNWHMRNLAEPCNLLDHHQNNGPVLKQMYPLHCERHLHEMNHQHCKEKIV